MAAVASYLGKVKFGTATNPPTVEVGKVASCDFSFEREKINVTPVGQTAIGGEDFILGKFMGTSFTLEVYRDLADAGQLAMHNALLTGDGRGYMIVEDNPSASAGLKGYGFMCIISAAPAPVSTSGASTQKYTVTVMGKVVAENGTIPTLST
jgi:hypothetical protein